MPVRRMTICSLCYRPTIQQDGMCTTCGKQVMREYREFVRQIDESRMSERGLTYGYLKKE